MKKTTEKQATNASHSSPEDKHSTDEEEKESFDADLSAADELFKYTDIGVYGTFSPPYSHQLKVSVRATFKNDEKTFDETDATEGKAIGDALHMRMITFGIFTIYTLVLLLYASGCFLSQSSNRHGNWRGFAVYCLIGLVANGLRWLCRHEYFSRIKTDAIQFAIEFSKRLNHLYTHSGNAIRAADTDLHMQPGWPKRAEGWIRIALWYSKRYEALDRYVTATAWRIESRFRIIENSFITAKGVVIVGALYFIFACAHLQLTGHIVQTLPLLLAIALHLVNTFFFWGLRPQPNNAYWEQIFSNSVAGFGKDQEHVCIQISKTVAGDKKTIMGGMHYVEGNNGNTTGE